jgi:hypothetical protein
MRCARARSVAISFLLGEKDENWDGVMSASKRRLNVVFGGSNMFKCFWLGSNRSRNYRRGHCQGGMVQIFIFFKKNLFHHSSTFNINNTWSPGTVRKQEVVPVVPGTRQTITHKKWAPSLCHGRHSWWHGNQTLALVTSSMTTQYMSCMK